MERWAAVPRSAVLAAPTSAALAVWIAQRAYPSRELATAEIASVTGLGARAVRAAREDARAIDRSLAQLPREAPGAGLGAAVLPLSELARARAAGPASLRLWCLAHLAADYATGIVRWGVDTVARFLSCCGRTVERAIARLVSAGLAERTGGPGLCRVRRLKTSPETDQNVATHRPLHATGTIEGPAAREPGPEQGPTGPDRGEIAAAAAELQHHAGPLSAVGLARLARRAAAGGSAALWRAVDVAADLADRAAFGGAFLPSADAIVSTVADRWRVFPRRIPRVAELVIAPPVAPHEPSPPPQPPAPKVRTVPEWTDAIGSWVAPAAARSPLVAAAVAEIDREVADFDLAARPEIAAAIPRALEDALRERAPAELSTAIDAAAAAAEQSTGSRYVRDVRRARAIGELL